jgi:hypothetical protein
MQISHCANCGKSTGHKRNIGIGTLLGALVTCGFSLLAVPFYPKRCILCGVTEGSRAQQPAFQSTAFGWRATFKFVGVLVGIFALVIAVLEILVR